MKQKVKLMFDYLQGAIWTSDVETGEPITGIDIIDKDGIIIKINCIKNCRSSLPPHCVI